VGFAATVRGDCIVTSGNSIENGIFIAGHTEDDSVPLHSRSIGLQRTPTMEIRVCSEGIRFSLPGGFTLLAIYDMKGRLVTSVPINCNQGFWRRAAVGPGRRSQICYIAQASNGLSSISVPFIQTP
jgi:hypothetical protein